MHGGSYRALVRGKFWLERRGRFVLGDGGVELLRAIDAGGSIRIAARAVGWSYRHALSYLDNAERRLAVSLVDRARGGHERGGAALTEAGRDFVTRYDRFRRQAEAAVHRLYDTAFS